MFYLKLNKIVEPYEIVRYLGEGKYDECEIAYNASFMVFLWDAIATRNARIVRTGLNNMARLPKEQLGLIMLDAMMILD